ncbi:MAG TPA: hypothetical protein VF896_08850 [Anaerolineales bacterium]
MTYKRGKLYRLAERSSAMPPQRPIHVADHARFAAAYTVKAVA